MKETLDEEEAERMLGDAVAAAYEVGRVPGEPGPVAPPPALVGDGLAERC